MKKKLSFLFLIFWISSIYSQTGSLPDFSLESISGEKVSLHKLLEKGPVYINFWALWCVPCRAELKALQSIYEKLQNKNVSIVAINIDSPRSSSKVKSFISGMKYSFDVLLDINQEVFQKFGGSSLPYSILIDGSGKIVKVRNSFLPGDEKEILKDIEGVLSKK
ncbi:MAG: TlpA disulfide reductase family protein [Ignavibacteria bacterium]